MSGFDDTEADRAAERIAQRLRESSARLPLRPAFVESLAIESQPAVHALLFAVSTDKAEDPNSLEHHETTAMVALLGRAFAMEGATPTAAHGVVPSLLGAFRAEGFAVPSSLDEPLSVVFLEGFVRGREERLRHDLEKRLLDHVVLRTVFPRVGLLFLQGGYESDGLSARLETLARQAFSAELASVVVDLELTEQATEDASGAILHFAELVASVGIRVVFHGTSSASLAEQAGAEARSNLPDALSHALTFAGLRVRGEHALVRPLRALFRGRGDAGPRT